VVVLLAIISTQRNRESVRGERAMRGNAQRSPFACTVMTWSARLASFLVRGVIINIHQSIFQSALIGTHPVANPCSSPLKRQTCVKVD